MTGHQVFSTLHTNSAVGSIPRLQDLGVLPDIMASNLISIVAQRLVRKLCKHCRQPQEVGELERKLLALDDMSPDVTIYQATGCPKCSFTGYRGRTSIVEILKINEYMKKLISQNTSAHELAKAAIATGFKTLADDAGRRVVEGVTSLDEITRVVDLTNRVGG
jgi:general secretion pathway protein E/type IV pilus assembly protein PilB